MKRILTFLLSVATLGTLLSCKAAGISEPSIAPAGETERLITMASDTAAPGPATLLYQGQASIRIVTDEGKVIYIDPYAEDGYDLPADLILSGTVSSIRSARPAATVVDGLAIAGTTAQNDTAAAKSAVEKWVTEDLKDILSMGTTDEAGKFDLEAGTVLLNNGVTMPILGIGTYRLSDQ